MDTNTRERDASIVESIHSSSTNQQHRKILQQAKESSPEQQVLAARKLFYGVILPAANNGEQVDANVVAEAEAWLESVFTTVESASMASSRSSRST